MNRKYGKLRIRMNSKKIQRIFNLILTLFKRKQKKIINIIKWKSNKLSRVMKKKQMILIRVMIKLTQRRKMMEKNC